MSAYDPLHGFDGELNTGRLDIEYNARATVSPECFAATMQDYLDATASARIHCLARADLPYSEDSGGPRLDLYGTNPGERRPAVMFIHGGYWRALTKEHSGFMASMLADRGIATIVPDYRLAPDASLAEIVHDVRSALAFTWHRGARLGIDRERITLCGSSAGGHLAASCIQPGWQVAYGLPDIAVRTALPVSGLFHLGPIARCHPQAWLSLSGEDVLHLSPLLKPPVRPAASHMRITVALAASEAEGFKRQSMAYHEALLAAGVSSSLLEIAGRNHFDVVLDLADPQSQLARTLLDLVTSDHQTA